MDEQLDFFSEDYQNQEGLEDLSLKLEQLQSAVLWGTDWTAETIVSQIEKGKIDLNPKFQRREAWDDKRKSTFIESLICGFPIPQIILAEGKTKNDPYIVIDGKQRLISLRRFFANKDDDTFKPLRLKGLSVLKNLNNNTYDEIKSNPHISDLVCQVENQPIRTIIIRNWPNEEFLYTVFLRLNTGSLPLSTQELRQALHPGEFLNFCDEYSSQDKYLRDILRITKADYRMRDIELMVRFFSFKYFINDYKGNLKLFLDESVNLLNQQFPNNIDEFKYAADSMDKSIDAVNQIFRENAFKKYKSHSFDRRFNRAVFDIMVYYFSEEQIRKTALQKKDQVFDGFTQLSKQDISFVTSFETSTKNIDQTSYRFTKWGEKLKDILGIDIILPIISNGAQ
ncbi:MAG: DUF262 domain-containing protein [Firmicutes bacterium]|nr:DUF262 domain-containing protein [Candidatus Alectryobacillus merdavium]